MKIQIRTFGRVAEIIGKNQWDHQGASNLDALKTELENSYPELKEIGYFFSVDRKLVKGNVALEQGAEVALMPPFFLEVKAMPNWKKYHRQMLLPGMGQKQQDLIFNSRVLVIGAGGLGCPVLLYLAAAGVGHLGIVDFDLVEESNLHRQIIYNPNDLGQPKAMVAANKIAAAYPDSEAIAYQVKLDGENAKQLLSSYDLVIDGSDNFETRYLLNDVCLSLNKPWIYASVSRFEGQLAVFNFPDSMGIKAHYRDLFPEMPAAGSIQNCAEAGVLGTLPGIIGSMQANEALKVICGLQTPLANCLLTYNALSNQIFETQIVW